MSRAHAGVDHIEHQPAASHCGAASYEDLLDCVGSMVSRVEMASASRRPPAVGTPPVQTASVRCFYYCQVVLGCGWVVVRSRKSSRLM